MKVVTRLLALLFALLLCFGSLIACGGGDETAATTTTSTTTSTTTTASGTSSQDTSSSSQFGGLFDAPIDWMQFKDSSCTFYYKNRNVWGESTLYIDESQVGANQADVASIARLDYFREKTGITMHGVTSSNQNNYTSLKTLLDSNDPANIPDIFFVSGSDAGNLLFNEELVILNGPDTPNMDFSKDCWHENVNNDLAIWGNYYAVSGYFDTANFERAATMFFDRDALETINPDAIDFSTYPELAGYIGEDSLYQWAKDGEWTWDKAVALAKLFAGVDGAFQGSAPAKNGIQYSDALSLIASVDLRPFKDDELGVPTLLLDMETQQKLNYLHQNITYEGASRYANYIGDLYTGGSNVNRPDLFNLNHTALFTVNLASRMTVYASYSTEATPFRFGILPLPKYNAQQENYYSNAGQWYTLLACIPKKCANLEFSTFVLQHFTEMGKYSYHKSVKTVYEAVIEDGLSGRYAATTDNAENDKAMLQIVMDSVGAWMWEYFGSQFTGADGPGKISLSLHFSAQPDWQSFNDSNMPKIRAVMYDVLIKLGLAEAA